jgi:hypothetical protein
MKKFLACFGFVLLGLAIRGSAQSEIRQQLMGSWYSTNRPDTVTMRFTNDSTVYFETKSPALFSGKPFSFFVYKIDDQPMIELTPPGGKVGMKLILRIIGPDEIKLQGVDVQDYDNPLQHVPKETDKNTFQLRRSGKGGRSDSQTVDDLKATKWVNYDRKRGIGDHTPGEYDEIQYHSIQGDTLLRLLAKNRGTKEVLYEESYIHGEKNGLAIYYFPNGVIKEIDYYLNGKIWETISRADSTGKLLDPGNLHNGSGIKFFYDFYLTEPNCYETFKEGLPDGPYYAVNGIGTCVKGNLQYKPSSALYLRAKKVRYVDSHGDSVTETFNMGDYKTVFNDLNRLNYKIIATWEDSVIQLPKTFPYIDIGFSDPAVIPVGQWQILNSRTNKTKGSIDYDANGNAVKLIWFDADGKILSKREFLPCNKQKVTKINADNSFFGDFCIEKME